MRHSNNSKKLLALLGASVLTVSLGASSVLQFNKASAATVMTNIFAEAVEEEVLADNNRWVSSVEDSTAVGIKQLGEAMYTVSPTGLAGLVQYDEKITLKKGQYAEFVVTMENITGGLPPLFDMRFSDTKIEGELTEATMATATEGYTLYADREATNRGMLYSTNAEVTGLGGWGNLVGTNATWLQWGNGNFALGATDGTKPNYAETNAFRYRMRIYPDGKASYAFAAPGQDNWFTTLYVGYSAVGVEATGFKPITEGYMQLMIRGASDVSFSEMSVAIYEADSFWSADNTAHVDGTLVANSKYEADLDDMENSKFKALSATAGVKPPLKAIGVENAADNDFVVKKTKLSAPDNFYADIIYDIATTLAIPELSGNAKAVVYAGAAAQDDMSAATKIEFSKNTDGKIVVTVGANSVVTDLKEQVPFDFNILAGGKGVNTVCINGAPLKISETENLTFNQLLSETFFGLGTTGVDVANGHKAFIGLTAAKIIKYNYTQGNGGDFVEEFENGKYNEANIAIAYRVQDHEMAQFFYADPDTGDLVVDNVGYTGEISTKQLYGDYDFKVEFSFFGQSIDGEGNAMTPDFIINWGRPSGEADYAAGGTSRGLYFTSSWGGSRVHVMGPIEFASGSGVNLPAEIALPCVDEEGKPATTNDIYKYDFSEGNLVFRLLHQDLTTELYIYTENCAEDDWGRVNPAIKMVNDYSYGAVGIGGVPTGSVMVLKIDKMSCSNLDEYKADNLIVGGASDVVDLDFTVEAPPEISNPFGEDGSEENSETSSAPVTNDDGGCGCGSIAGVGTGLMAMVGAFGVAVIAKKRRK